MCGEVTHRDKLESPAILMGSSNEYKCKMQIYLKDLNEKRSLKSFVSVYAYLVYCPVLEVKGSLKNFSDKL